jgi:BirA family transcriptional regulator, biotin operon repressor / biotin---[acetyl-CoA-carboxylase] ligase
MYDTGFTGSQRIRLHSVDSTNNYAAKLVKDTKVFDGTIITAFEQTSGKGQLGNKWRSEAGKNLTLSLIVYPKNLDPANHYILSQVAALAVSDLLLVFGIDHSIKWPNDIITAKGKISGILIENNIAGDRVSHSIIGIGLNVNQSVFDPEIKATSMFDVLGEETELESLLNLFCNMFDKWYLMLNANRQEYIHNTYMLRLLNFGKFAPYVFKGDTIEARILNVEKNGILVLEKKDGTPIKAELKEISFVF